MYTFFCDEINNLLIFYNLQFCKIILLYLQFFKIIITILYVWCFFHFWVFVMEEPNKKMW